MKEIIQPIEFDESLRKKSINISVPGKPRGKERPRMARIGRHMTTYTPKNTVEYENKIRRIYRNFYGNFKLENAIEAEITAIFPIPESTSRKQREKLLQGNAYHTKKPDCDNVAKISLDALNKLAYNDDSQVCKLSVVKKYGENPVLEINLFEI